MGKLGESYGRSWESYENVIKFSEKILGKLRESFGRVMWERHRRKFDGKATGKLGSVVRKLQESERQAFIQSWALSVFFNFFNDEKLFFCLFVKSI